MRKIEARELEIFIAWLPPDIVAPALLLIIKMDPLLIWVRCSIAIWLAAILAAGWLFIALIVLLFNIAISAPFKLALLFIERIPLL